MKISTIILFLLLPVITFAQTNRGMGEEELKNMLVQMEKMKTCMQDIDPLQLKLFEDRSNKSNTEIRSLCAKGKRDEAQKKAIAFNKEVENNPAIKKIIKCGKLMENVMPSEEHEKDHSGQNICD